MKALLILFVLVLLPVKTFAQVTQQNYPELLVVPKASERLMIEARRAYQNDWSNHLPLHAASATTLVAGILSMGELDKDKDEQGIGPKVAIAVGAGWLATSIWLQTSYRPYNRGLGEIKKIPNQNLRDQLAIERLAEEHIHEAASLARKIKWLSFLTNAGANIMAFDSAKKDTAAQGVAMLGTATSLLPLIFPLSWEKVSDDHQSYKKKVFGPLTFTNGLLINPVNQKPSMGLVIGTYF